MPIRFYRTHEPHGCFSNFSAHPFELEGKLWPTSEHYFQAQKFAGTEYEEAIRLATSPMIAARMGRDRNKPLRKDWETVKLDVMRTALRAKFTAHADIGERLLSTGEEEILEAASNDYFWGEGDKTGKNWLGKLLMELREELRKNHG